MLNWIRYGWPRRYIVRGSIWLRHRNLISEATDDRICDWLYPSLGEIIFAARPELKSKSK